MCSSDLLSGLSGRISLLVVLMVLLLLHSRLLKLLLPLVMSIVQTAVDCVYLLMDGVLAVSYFGCFFGVLNCY